MNLSPSTHYESTQKFVLMPAILFTLVGMLASAVIGAIYAVISFYSPAIFIDGLLLFCLFFGLGFIIRTMTRLAKSRNQIVNMVMAFFMCLIAYYVNIVTFLAQLYEDPFLVLEIFLSPYFVVDFMFNNVIPYREITITGNSGRGGLAVSGMVLALVYLVELAVYFLPIWFATKPSYFCEACQQWYKQTTYYAFSSPELNQTISQCPSGKYADALKDVTFFNNYKALIPQIPKDSTSVDIIVVKYYYCPTCKQNSLIDIQKMSLAKQKKSFVLKNDRGGQVVKGCYLDGATDGIFNKISI